MIRQYPNSTMVFDYYQLENELETDKPELFYIGTDYELLTDEDDEVIFRTQRVYKPDKRFTLLFQQKHYWTEEIEEMNQAFEEEGANGINKINFKKFAKDVDI